MNEISVVHKGKVYIVRGHCDECGIRVKKKAKIKNLVEVMEKMKSACQCEKKGKKHVSTKRVSD